MALQSVVPVVAAEPAADEAAVVHALEPHAARLVLGEPHLASREDGIALLAAAGFQSSTDAVPLVVSCSELREKLSTAAAAADMPGGQNGPQPLQHRLGKAIHVAMSSIEGARGDSVTAEDIRQALRLGTEDSACVFASRLHGCDPRQGQWVTRAWLDTYLRERRDAKRGLWSLLMTLSLLVTSAVATLVHFRAEAVRDVGSVIRDGLDSWVMRHPAVELGLARSVNEADSFWPWLDTHPAFDDGLVAPNVKVIGGLRLERLLHFQPASQPAVLCSDGIFDFLSDVVRGKFQEIPLTALCGQPVASTSHLIVLHDHAQRDTMLDAARTSWENGANTTGFNVRVLVQGCATGTSTSCASVADVFAFGDVSLRLDKSGLVEKDVTVDAFHAGKTCNDDYSCTLADSLLLFLCIGLLLTQSFAICSVCRWSGFCRRLLASMSRQIAIDIVAALTGLAWVLFWWASDHFAKGILELSVNLSSSDEHARQRYVEAIVEQVGRVTEAKRWCHMCLLVFLICVCVRLLDDLRAFLRFRPLMIALHDMAIDLRQLLLMAGLLLIVFALSAHLLFGAYVLGFGDSVKIDDVTSAYFSTLSAVVLMVTGHGGVQIRSRLRAIMGPRGMIWMATLSIVALLVFLQHVLASAFGAYLRARDEARRRSQQARPSFWLRSNALVRNLLTSPVLLSDADLKKATENLSEERLRQWLANDRGKGGDELLNSKSVAEALGAQTPAAEAWLELLFSEATKEAEISKAHLPYWAQTSVNFEDAFRVMARFDANAHDLLRAGESMHRFLEPVAPERYAGGDDRRALDRWAATSGQQHGASAAITSAAAPATAGAGTGVEQANVHAPVAVLDEASLAEVPDDLLRALSAKVNALQPHITEVQKENTVEKAATCPTCGNVFMSDAVYCRKCGNPRGEAERGIASDDEKVTTLALQATETKKTVAKRLKELDEADAARCAAVQAQLNELEGKLAQIEASRQAVAVERSARFQGVEREVEDLLLKIAPLYNAL